ncbi:V/A-type H+-transporting ATPase subunit A [Persephonella hydrogeniphila]|uniref:V-type ATP synthase alpha chain n=1 Tax=Persephonella hydrogeniphila TaxID=198703 RepID=A0A285NJM8_9AQUI|nr:V-type ATP synthase subunit A [Persephonella hydrogeniphila]SNZ09157.1 V/A-type H+-transporting ATPase subunit A [Persephonella hydrogeniphila]
MAVVSSISGPIVRVRLKEESPALFELTYVGKKGLVGEVVDIHGTEAVIQVYEDTEGLSLGEDVSFSGEMLSAILGPGLLGGIFDGIQRPLPFLDFQIKKGIKPFSLDREKKWHFKPYLEVGNSIQKGMMIGEVKEGSFTHKIISSIEGKVSFIAEEGDYTVEDTILKTEDGKEIKLYQKHPIRIPRRFRKRKAPEIPLITGQRVIDFLFPIAKGGTGSIPGGFGTGKTVLQQTLAKWCDADVIVYIGCGERGNEMTEVLTEFSKLKDPKSGRLLMERTVLIANTSDMPVSAREASIFMGITIAEYYRDMGYHVALMADSTSRWAEAMREISARMKQLPVEEGFPSDLSSKIASIYERAGFVETLSGLDGSLTIIGAVSPPGGDFSEPVTRHTRRFTSVFWALDKDLASARFYPAINYTISYSSYPPNVSKWWEDISYGYQELRNWMIYILQEDDKLQRIVKLLGMEALPEEQKLVVETANLIKEVFLQQNAFDPVDAYSSPERQIKMAQFLKTMWDLWEKAHREKAIPVSILRKQAVITDFVRAKYSVKNDELEKYDSLIKKLVETYQNLIATYGD